MQEINVLELKSWPKNNYFFDDIQGENWTAFKNSIKTSGVIEPVIVTQNKVIVSGHQRVRACKELGIKNVLCDMRSYNSDDKITKDILETNLRQRGIGNTNPIKLGRCLVELERIYGIHNGGNGSNQYQSNELDSQTAKVAQSDIRSNLDMSKDSYADYKRLTTLIPEFQDMVQEGKVTKWTASRIIARLSSTDQQELITTYGKNAIEKATNEKTQQMIEEMNRLNNVNWVKEYSMTATPSLSQ